MTPVFVQTRDSVRVAVHDLGGCGPPLLFCHAAGFCAGTWRPVAAVLGGWFHCWGVDLRAHGLSGHRPDDDLGWAGFAEDVRRAACSLPEAPCAVGHSVGASALLLAEATRPGTFRSLFCYEPIVAARAVGRPENGAFADWAASRPGQFESLIQAHSWLQAHRPFASLDRDVRDEYVRHGMRVHASGRVSLRCRPGHQAQVYRRAADNGLPESLAGLRDTPVTFSVGARSPVVDEEITRLLVLAVPGSKSLSVPSADHLAPLIEPARFAAIVRMALAEVAQEGCPGARLPITPTSGGDDPTMTNEPSQLIGANLAAHLAACSSASGWDDRVAYAQGRRAWRHREVHVGAARLAALFTTVAGPDDRVMVVVPDSIEFVWAFLGVLGAGAIAVLVNPALTSREHRAAIRACDPAAVVCPARLGPVFADRRVITVESLPAETGSRAAMPAAPRGPSAAAYAQFTSGTTGPPRLAVHRHGDPLVFQEALGRQILRLSPDDVVLSAAKMFFAYGLGNSLFYPLLAGSRTVLLPDRPTAADLARAVATESVSVLFSVPASYAKLLDEPGCGRRLSGLRLAVSAGETLPPAVATRFAQTVRAPLVDTLGSTEVGQAFTASRPEQPHPGTVGYVLPPYQVRVVDSGGTPLPDDAPGLLQVSGPTIARRFLDEASAGVPSAGLSTADEMFDGDWLRTTDRASIAADGTLRLHGRADDIENVGGYKVHPGEVEELLSAHPFVVECAVCTVCGTGGSARLHAFVVRSPRGPDDDDLRCELDRWARTHLADYKVPRTVQFVTGLPRTPTGKLRRHIIREPGWTMLADYC